MNLIDENFEEKKIKEDKNKKIAKIILILMGVILVVIIGLIGAMAYIKSSELQVYLNGSANPKIKDTPISIQSLCLPLCIHHATGLDEFKEHSFDEYYQNLLSRSSEYRM